MKGTGYLSDSRINSQGQWDKYPVLPGPVIYSVAGYRRDTTAAVQLTTSTLASRESWIESWIASRQVSYLLQQREFVTNIVRLFLVCIIVT